MKQSAEGSRRLNDVRRVQLDSRAAASAMAISALLAAEGPTAAESRRAEAWTGWRERKKAQRAAKREARQSKAVRDCVCGIVIARHGCECP